MEYRRITRECVDRDWHGCRAHDDVMRLRAGDDIIRQFTNQTPETW